MTVGSNHIYIKKTSSVAWICWLTSVLGFFGNIALSCV